MTNITRVMQKIGFNTSLDITKIVPEKLGATIKQMDHKFPTIFHESPMYSFFILSGHINFYCNDTMMSIVRIHMLRTHERDFPGITKIHVARSI